MKWSVLHNSFNIGTSDCKHRNVVWLGVLHILSNIVFTEHPRFWENLGDPLFLLAVESLNRCYKE